jgi:Ribbon-helix-helix protein, copG family
MRRTNVYLSDEQLEALRHLGARRGEPVAQLVREAVDSWLASQNVRLVPEEEWGRRFGELLARRSAIARERGWTEEEVERDVTAAVREVRRARTARRR